MIYVKHMGDYPNVATQVGVTQNLLTNMWPFQYRIIYNVLSDDSFLTLVIVIYNLLTDGYSTENLVFEWNPKPVSRDQNFALAQFSLDKMRTLRCDKTYVGGTDGHAGDCPLHFVLLFCLVCFRYVVQLNECKTTPNI